MKKISIIGLAVGSAMIGFFANKLGTPVGSICFALAVTMLVVSIIAISKEDK